MDREELACVWHKRLATFARSGMTIQKWCDQNSTTVRQFGYWRQRLAGQRDSETPLQQWAAVEIAEPSSTPTVPGGVTVRVAGASIELQPGFDPAMLRAVVRALAADQC